jgi:hypothetical protein
MDAHTIAGCRDSGSYLRLRLNRSSKNYALGSVAASSDNIELGALVSAYVDMKKGLDEVRDN